MKKNKMIPRITLLALMTGLGVCQVNGAIAGGDKQEVPRVLERFSDYRMQFLNLDYEAKQKMIDDLQNSIDVYGQNNDLKSNRIELTLNILLSEFKDSTMNLSPATEQDKESANEKLTNLDTLIAKEIQKSISGIATSELINSLKYTSTGSGSIIGDMAYTSMGTDSEGSFRLDITDYSLMQNIFDMVLKADMRFELDSQTLGGNITAEGTIENIQKNGKQYVKFSDVELSSDISEINEEFNNFKDELPFGKYILIDNPDTSAIAALQNLSSSELSELLTTLFSTSDLEVISTSGDNVYLRLTQASCNRIKKSARDISELFGNAQDMSDTCSKSELNEIRTSLGQIYLTIEDDTSSINIESEDGLNIVITYNDDEIISTSVSFTDDFTEATYKQSGDDFSLEIYAPDTTFALVQKDKTIAGKLAVQTGSEKITGTMAGKGDMLSWDVQDLIMNVDITDANGGKIGSFSFIKELGNYSLNIAIGSFYSLSGKYTSSKDDSVDFEAIAKVLGSQVFMLHGSGNVDDDGIDIKYNGKVTIPSNAQAEFSGSAKTEKSGNNTKQDFIYKLDLETNIEEFEKLDLNLQIISDETRIKGKTTQVEEPSNYETINY